VDKKLGDYICEVFDYRWTFKCIRYPDGNIRKLKVRLCCRGDQPAHVINFFDTFAPVVFWATVRILLILSVILGVDIKRVDYICAVLDYRWTFKCKRYPDGNIRKLKARFCCRGDQPAHGIDYFDTFASVVSCTRVRILLFSQ